MNRATKSMGGLAFGLVGSTSVRRAGASRSVALSHLRKLRKCEQVAAVCYRLRGEFVEFLLVQTRGRGRWTFPKGSAERGLTHAQAAALEAFEEAGVHGRMEDESFAHYVCRKRTPKKFSSQPRQQHLTVSAYLCQVIRLGKPKEAGRNRTWFIAEEAATRLAEGRNENDGATFRRVIEKAAARIHSLCGALCPKSDPVHNGSQNRGEQNGDSRRDGLQKVLFEASEQARGGEAWFNRHIGRQRSEPPRARGIVVPQRKLLSGDVLLFSSRKKKVHSLESGLGD